MKKQRFYRFTVNTEKLIDKVVKTEGLIDDKGVDWGLDENFDFLMVDSVDTVAYYIYQSMMRDLDACDVSYVFKGRECSRRILIPISDEPLSKKQCYQLREFLLTYDCLDFSIME